MPSQSFLSAFEADGSLICNKMYVVRVRLKLFLKRVVLRK